MQREIKVGSDLFGTDNITIFCLDNLDDYIQKHIFSSSQFYEYDLLKFVAVSFPDIDVFVDVGANIGNHSLFFANVLGSFVIAFEPNIRNAQRLKINILTNNLEDRSIIFNEAVGANVGIAESTISGPSINSGGAGVKILSRTSENSVPIARLDERLVVLEEVKNAKKLCLKIDVEGMEYDVLVGAIGFVEHFSPIIICEINSDVNFVKIRRLLEPLGYFIYASFFKTATFVFVPASSFRGLSKHWFENSWREGRHYVQYCDLSRQNGRLLKIFNQIKHITSIEKP